MREQARAANDGLNRSIGVAVRARLCSAVAAILVHGLRPDLGAPSLWQLVAASVAEAQQRQLAAGTPRVAPGRPAEQHARGGPSSASVPSTVTAHDACR